MAVWEAALAGKFLRNGTQTVLGHHGKEFGRRALRGRGILLAHSKTSMPTRRMTLNSAKVGPVAFLVPRSSCET